MQLLALAIALGLAVAGDIYDVELTERGIRKGIAVEGFTWLVGQKPSAEALYFRDSLIICLATAPAIAALATGHAPLFWGALAGPVVMAAKHIQGGLAWRYMLKGGKLDWEGFPVPADGKAVAHSALAKLIGPWCW
jgi:hypothetical protein